MQGNQRQIENKFNEAESALQENRTALRAVAQPDALLLEQTEFALAAVAFQRQTAVKEELREYTTAEQRYLGALQQFPESAEAPKARYHLGQCYWFVASQKSKALGGGTLTDEERKAYKKQESESLQKAGEQFEKIETALMARKKAGALSTEEEALLWRSSFLVAHCTFYLAKFEEAIRQYGLLATRYQGQVGELGALSQVFQCHVQSRQPDKAKAILSRMRAALDKMPDSVFVGPDETFQKAFWLKWFVDAEKVLAEAGKSSTTP
jgi:hypothetical protein